MGINSRRRFFGKAASLLATAISAPTLLGEQASAPSAPPDDRARRIGNRIHNGIYYFSGTGSNDGYGKDDHIQVTDPFERHVTRAMDALKRSLERNGSTIDNILNMQVFLCLPHADSIPMPTGKARFDAHKTQYDALNKIYGTYFTQGKAPSRACMAVEWIPGDSLIELVGSALVVNPPAPSTAPAVPKPPAGI